MIVNNINLRFGHRRMTLIGGLDDVGRASRVSEGTGQNDWCLPYVAVYRRGHLLRFRARLASTPTGLFVRGSTRSLHDAAFESSMVARENSQATTHTRQAPSK